MQKMNGLELWGGALKVMGNVTIRYSAYGFLFNFHRKAHSRNRPTATDEKNKNISILVVISVVGTISGKSLNLLPPVVIF